jgi:flagellar P-ring protein precursor FlgI
MARRHRRIYCSRPQRAHRGVHRKRLTAVFAVLALLVTNFAPLTAFGVSRIKDISDFEGVRDNQLVGYGLVVGLDGTGDSLRNSPFTRQSLEGMLERLGINTRDAPNLNTQNVAAVMVTGNLPAFARQGTRIDVTVSALGDAQSLLGGTLLVTPLLGADGAVYAVAQGNLAVGGFKASGAAETVTKGVSTSARIANGAIVEKEVQFDLADMHELHLSLKNPDFTTASRVAQVINGDIGPGTAKPLDPATVLLTVPPTYKKNMFSLITDIEQLPVTPDQPARIIIDEQSGIIVMGSDVRVSTVAIAQGNLTIRVTETPQVSQPQPFSQGGQTTTVPRTSVDVQEDDKKLAVLKTGVKLQDLVDGLNALGIGPRDMIQILQALKAAGALQAEIELL